MGAALIVLLVSAKDDYERALKRYERAIAGANLQGMTQTEIARVLELSQSMVSRIVSRWTQTTKTITDNPFEGRT